MLDLLQRLKINYRLAALTTISKGWLDFKRKKFDLDKYSETIVSSGYTGWAKPDPEIYDILIKKLNVDPKTCLFVDDDEYKLPPAQKLGMTTILFINQKDLETKLVDLGIKM
jgi:HAD superfamily hydrolase (TIGR01549 family)